MPVQPAMEYRDLDLNFTAHTNTKKLSILTGSRAITRAVRNLLLTNHYERPFHPEIGSGVTSYLFENIEPSTADRLQSEIEVVLQNFEPRVKLNKVQVSVDEASNGFYVTLFYFLSGQPKEQVSNIFLERTR